MEFLDSFLHPFLLLCALLGLAVLHALDILGIVVAAVGSAHQNLLAEAFLGDSDPLRVLQLGREEPVVPPRIPDLGHPGPPELVRGGVELSGAAFDGMFEQNVSRFGLAFQVEVELD